MVDELRARVKVRELANVFWREARVELEDSLKFATEGGAFDSLESGEWIDRANSQLGEDFDD